MSKRSALDLAVCGGAPAFEPPLHVGRPNLGSRQALYQRLDDVLERRWLSNNGRYVQELEAKVCSMLGVKHAVAVCNATIGLEVAARALELKGEIIVPAFSFVASAHAFQWVGLKPVFVDVNLDDHNIDVGKIEASLTDRTSAILGVHLWGNACDTGALQSLVERKQLKLIYDAAHAFACSSPYGMIGNFGDVEVFSFHATKFINAFEGGVMTTNSDALAKKIRLMINFGFGGYDSVVSEGTNGKMSEVSAAMALTNIESISSIVDTNHTNYHAYCRHLLPLDGIRVLPVQESVQHNYQYVVLEVDAEKFGINRDQLHQVLQADGVLARRYFAPGIHRMEPYASDPTYANLQLKATEQLCDSVLVLPTGQAVDEAAIETICSIIAFAPTALANRKTP